MYSLYGQPRYFKLKRKYQQYGPCFQTIFPFLIVMALQITSVENRTENILLPRP